MAPSSSPIGPATVCRIRGSPTCSRRGTARIGSPRMMASPSSMSAPAACQTTAGVRPGSGLHGPSSRRAFEGPRTQRQVRVLLEDRAGRIWAGGRGGLSVLDRSGSGLTFRPVVPSPPAMVTSLLEDAGGGLWIGTLGRLVPCDCHPARCFRCPRPRAPAHARCGRWFRTAQGRLWVGHDDGLLVLVPGATAQGRSRPACAVA